MGFQTNNGQNNGSNNGGGNSNTNTVGFINFYMGNASGDGNTKVGAIALKGTRVKEKELHDWLMAVDKKGDEAVREKRLQTLMNRLSIQYVPITGKPGSGFDLSDEDDEQAPAPGTGTNG